MKKYLQLLLISTSVLVDTDRGACSGGGPEDSTVARTVSVQRILLEKLLEQLPSPEIIETAISQYPGSLLTPSLNAISRHLAKGIRPILLIEKEL